MIFNSYLFIFIFFPIIFIVYFVCNKLNYYRLGNIFLLLSSLIFYSYWDVCYLPLLLLSITTNYTIGKLIISFEKKLLFAVLGILFNIILLGFYKYSNFFITNINIFLDKNISLLNIILPLGISFFTFTQIAFLIDTYREKVKEVNFLNYALFVTYFPHLLAGPILHHSQMMPQFSDTTKRSIHYKNLLLGLMLFSIGLFKKAYIADKLAESVGYGYATIDFLSTIEAWLLTLCYTFQLYFDFSGYTDMAIGCSLMLNITLPQNFNSPYKALNIQEFWRRWHMTLSQWLKEYIYIPLGGNQHGKFRTYFNLVATFLIGGIWHGAGWTFAVWGLLHGIAISVHRFWQTIGFCLPKIISWALTFLFINIAWIFFRAHSISQAMQLIQKMFQPLHMELPHSLRDLLYQHSLIHLTLDHRSFIFFLICFTYICFATKNSFALKDQYAATMTGNIFIGSLLALGILSLSRVTTFLYFQF